MAHSSTAPAILLLNDILPGGELKKTESGRPPNWSWDAVDKKMKIEADAADS